MAVLCENLARISIPGVGDSSFNRVSPPLCLRIAGSGRRFVISGAIKAGKRRKSAKTARQEEEHAAIDFRKQAEVVAASLDANGLVQTVKHLQDVPEVLPCLVGAVLKRTRRYEIALAFFLWAREQAGYKHNVYTYNCMLASLAMARSRDLSKVYDQMLDDGVAPNRDTYILLIKGLCRLGRLHEAREMVTEMIVEGHRPDIVTCGILVERLCRHKKLAEVYELFQELDSNGAAVGMLAYDSVLGMLISSGNVDGALRFSSIVTGDGSLPHVLACKTTLNVLLKSGKEREAFQLLDSMIRKSTPDLTIYAALIDVLCKHNKHEEATKVLKVMLEKKIFPSPDVYSALIAAYCCAKRPEAAYRLFVNMLQQGYNLSPDLYGFLLKVLSQEGRGKLAYEIHATMRTLGHIPDSTTYSCLIYSCYMDDGTIEQAKELVTEVLDGRNVPWFARSFNELIQKLCAECKVDQAVELIAEMVDRGCEPSLDTYNALLWGFFNSNQDAKALELYEGMQERGFTLNSVVYSTLVQGLCKAGKLNEAYEIFRQGVGSEGRYCFPDRASYDALMKGLFNMA